MDLPIEAPGARLRSLDQEGVSQTGVYLCGYLHQFLSSSLQREIQPPGGISFYLVVTISRRRHVENNI